VPLVVPTISLSKIYGKVRSLIYINFLEIIAEHFSKFLS